MHHVSALRAARGSKICLYTCGSSRSSLRTRARARRLSSNLNCANRLRRSPSAAPFMPRTADDNALHAVNARHCAGIMRSSCWPLARSACRARLGQYMYVSASHARHSATCAPRPLLAGRDPTSTCTRPSTSISSQKLPSKLYTDPYTPAPSAQRRTMACMCPPVTALGRVGRQESVGLSYSRLSAKTCPSTHPDPVDEPSRVSRHKRPISLPV